MGIQRAIGRLVDELPEERITRRLIDTYWAKAAGSLLWQVEETNNCLADKVTTRTAWEGSRLNMVTWMFPHI
jgi:hypothetical protein